MSVNLASHDSCTCCECCRNICSYGAITIITDKFGFTYPSINASLCTDCGACERRCPILQPSLFVSKPYICYIGAAKDHALLHNSSSGGIFPVAALRIIADGGCVFGVAMTFCNGKVSINHRMIDDIDGIAALQGSKYVQSSILDTYKDCRSELQNGRTVLFSGTPCQIAGLRTYLGRDYECLFTIDIVCHGVPGQLFFQKHLDYLQQKTGMEITNVLFRDKERGWGFKGRLTFRQNDGGTVNQVFNSSVDSYYRLFLDADIYRPSCYNCRYACAERCGDISLGDFWGISRLKTVGYAKELSIEDGVSCVLVNTNRGAELLSLIKDRLVLEQTDYNTVACKNDQLMHPSRKGRLHDIILDKMLLNDYHLIDDIVRKSMGLKYYYKIVIGKVPYRFKKALSSLKHF